MGVGDELQGGDEGPSFPPATTLVVKRPVG